MSNITGEDGSFSSGNTGEEVQQKLQVNHHQQQQKTSSNGSPPQQQQPQQQQQQPVKKKRNLPGTPDPNAEVVALSPTTLMATNRFVCEICNKGFQRDQNLQLHRRGHNLPWKLRQRSSNEIKKRVYICPEPTCVHHNPARALGDLTGIKKHFSRKHGEKKWKCDKCSKKYAVQSDWKAHQKTCGTREYKCDCGTIFSRRDSFITHRAFCDALAEENSKVNQGLISNLQTQVPDHLISSMPHLTTSSNASMAISDFDPKNPLRSLPQELMPMPYKSINMDGPMFSSSSGALFGTPRSISSSSSSLQLSSSSSSGFNYLQESKNGCQISGAAHMSATALLQKAAQMGATASNSINSPMMQKSFVTNMAGPDQLSSINRPPSFNNSYHQYPSQPDQSTMVGINAGAGAGLVPNQLVQKNPEEISKIFGSGSDSSAMNDMGMFTSILMGGGEQGQGFLKVMEDGRSALNGNQTGPSRFRGSRSGGADMMTLDFMGIGGSRPPNLHEQQQQQRSLEMEAMNQQRLPIMNPFHQQLSHGDSAIEKPIWDV